MRIPVRGDTCLHPQCLDLASYLAMNSGPSPRWKCPLCRESLMPHQLWVDSFACLVLRALARWGLTLGNG